jgi:enoyl-CoA hydratase
MENQAQAIPPEILTERRGGVGIITINRPAALNALNLTVLTGVKEALAVWKNDPEVHAIVLRGTGEKAFCAGGDLKHFHSAGQAYKRGEVPLELPVSFFGLEYGLNAAIYHYPKPIIAFMHGITMGGGYGLAGNAHIRIACESTVFAMPETKIGFFPDVGAVSHLTKAPSHLGRYLAMTGLTLSGSDVVQAGLADAYVEKASFDNILQDLAEGDFEDRPGIEKALENYSVSHSISDGFSTLCEFCEAHFGFSEAESILRSLEASASPLAQGVLAELAGRSPLSVLVALEHYNRALTEDFDTVIARDYQLCARFIQGQDLYEGIRALLIDKDKTPRWQHKSIRDVPAADVSHCFAPCVPPLASLGI